MTMIRLLASLALILGLCAPAGAAPLAKQLFGAKSTASNHQPAPFGSYSKGCVAGAVQLPETGPTWQAMRLSRNRNWGYPETLSSSRISAARPPGNRAGRGSISAISASRAAGR